MNWNKIIASLKSSSDWHHKQAEDYAMLLGYKEKIRHHRLLSSVASMLADSLSIGLELIDYKKVLEVYIAYVECSEGTDFLPAKLDDLSLEENVALNEAGLKGRTEGQIKYRQDWMKKNLE